VAIRSPPERLSTLTSATSQRDVWFGLIRFSLDDSSEPKTRMRRVARADVCVRARRRLAPACFAVDCYRELLAICLVGNSAK
jgi:hypothetical protein